MGDKDFVLAADGWVQVTPCGEFPHVGAGVTQVIDREACDRIAADFNGRKSDANFPGVLVDFDHFSLDTEKSSAAAGWISDLESRDTGLWARVRWSDAGLAAVQGGRFRLMSPVLPPPSACEAGELTTQVFKFTERSWPLSLETLDKTGYLCNAIRM